MTIMVVVADEEVVIVRKEVEEVTESEEESDEESEEEEEESSSEEEEWNFTSTSPYVATDGQPSSSRLRTYWLDLPLRSLRCKLILFFSNTAQNLQF